jgi:hypothetical protein
VYSVVKNGVPALLILLGFVAVMGGYTLEFITGDVGMRNFGIILIIIGGSHLYNRTCAVLL